MKSYLYGETAFHHEGDLNFLLKLIDLAKETGLSGVKFQVLIEASELMSTKNSIYDNFSKWIFTEKQWKEVFNYCEKLGLDVVAMPLDKKAFDVVGESKIRFLDLHSVSFHDKDVLDRLKATNLPIIIGIGGRTLDEIIEKIEFFKGRQIVLMVGFQSFPTDLMNVKIGKIAALKELFPNVEIGYADHTIHSDEYGVYSNEYAYLLGATFFEKHITTQEGVKRIDFEAAIGKEKINQLVTRLNFLERLLSYQPHTLFTLDAPELKYRNREKLCVTTKDLPAGHTITSPDLIRKMIDKENGVANPMQLIGKKLKKAVVKDDLLTEDSFE